MVGGLALLRGRAGPEANHTIEGTILGLIDIADLNCRIINEGRVEGQGHGGQTFHALVGGVIVDLVEVVRSVALFANALVVGFSELP